MSLKDSIEMDLDIRNSNLRQLDFKIKALKRVDDLTDYQKEYLTKAIAKKEQIIKQNRIILGEWKWEYK